ncbi:hypothetical protein BYI23_D009540 (plasmid) [Burkholderia sp. YI23]|nr:hypothetical protein BYI23_D009540 [Burkholderia sp. YI23]
MADAERRRHQRERIVEQIADPRDAAARRQRMIAPREQHDRLRRTRAHLDTRMRRRIVRKPDMRAALRDFFEQIVDGEHLHVDLQTRVTRAEGREHVIDERIDIALAHREANLALLQSLQRVQLVFELFLLRPIASPELQQMKRRFGRPHAARLALEERRVEFVLQQPDLPRDYGRRGVQMIRGAADRAVRQHFVKVTQALLIDFAHGR